MIPYIINAGLILAGCLAFYKLLLQKETFYKLNRYVLVTCIVVSFSLPLLPVPQQWSLRKAEPVAILDEKADLNTKPANTGNAAAPNAARQENKVNPNTTPPNTITSTPPQNSVSSTPNTTATSPFTLRKALTWLMYLYWFGVIVFALNFLAQIAVLLYRAYTQPVIKDGKFRIVEVSGNKAPCSFANNIFINPEKYDWDTYNQILLHEKVHIMQGHSWDIILAEIVLIFQWFNPFAWIYRKEIENNLEFLTDDDLVQHKGVEVSTYQMSLLKVSAPHFPLSLTTNYNQSLLKKRIAMMNAKKSNVHTAWKYLFLLPLLVMFACILNEPVAYGQSRERTVRDDKNREDNNIRRHNNDGIETEGVWFATIKGEKIHIRFKQEDDDNDNYNGSSFRLSDFSDLPRDGSGSFSLTRDAGTMRFTGRFEGNEGMGRYKFTPNEQYANYMEDEGMGNMNDRDVMVFFFVDVKRSYVRMLKDQGFRNFDKDDIIPMAALNVSEDFISSIRNSGYKDVQMQTLVSLKALGVDGDYIREIRDAGYKNIGLDQLISFKAQGIDKDYLTKLERANLRLRDGGDRGRNNNNRNNNRNQNDDEDDNDVGHDGRISADDVVALKALNVTEDYINSFKEVGYTNISNSNIISMKAMGITPAYIKTIQDMGYSKLPISDIVAFKAQNITSDYIRSFEAVGYDNIPISELIAFKATGVTPEFIKSFESVGFTDIPMSQITSLKAMGITPSYIQNMRDKGFNYKRIDKYVQLKAVTE
jgi:hypothetical protein